MTEDILEQLRRTDLTPAEMLRVMGEAGNEILRLRARAVEERQRVRHEVADEIERLRAKNERFQALIDAFVAVDQNPDDTGWDDAYNALYAAATKEDDRG